MAYTITKQVLASGKFTTAKYTKYSDTKYMIEIAIGEIPAKIKIAYCKGAGRNPFDRSGYEAWVRSWRSKRWPTPQKALAAACKMLSSNG